MKREVMIKLYVETDVNDDHENQFGLIPLLTAVQNTAAEVSGDEDVIASFKIMPRTGTAYFVNKKGEA